MLLSCEHIDIDIYPVNGGGFTPPTRVFVSNFSFTGQFGSGFCQILLQMHTTILLVRITPSGIWYDFIRPR